MHLIEGLEINTIGALIQENLRTGQFLLSRGVFSFASLFFPGPCNVVLVPVFLLKKSLVVSWDEFDLFFLGCFTHILNKKIK